MVATGYWRAVGQTLGRPRASRFTGIAPIVADVLASVASARPRAARGPGPRQRLLSYERLARPTLRRRHRTLQSLYRPIRVSQHHPRMGRWARIGAVSALSTRRCQDIAGIPRS